MAFRLLGFVAGLLATCGGHASEPESIELELEAGPHARNNTLVQVILPATLKQAGSLSLERSADHKPVPVQRLEGTVEGVAWFLEEPLAAGSSRRYRLSKAARRPPDSKNEVVRDRSGNLVAMSREGRPILTYHAVTAEPPQGIESLFHRSGFIHPLATPSGAVVTDDFPPDHAHQHGLFFAWVNTTYRGRPVDFWNQKAGTGQVAHEGIREVFGGQVLPGFTVALRHAMFSDADVPARVLDEVWRIRVGQLPGAVLIDFESEQTIAGTIPLKINKYHYGGFALRGNRGWFDPSVNGNDPPDPSRSGRSDFLTSDGKRRADGNHTRPRWVDLSGEVDGRMAGVTILDHPGNFRFPQSVRLHPNKPYLSFSPMVLGEFELVPGRPYVSRYRLLVHDGPPDARGIDEAWADYAEPPVVRVAPNSR